MVQLRAKPPLPPVPRSLKRFIIRLDARLAESNLRGNDAALTTGPCLDLTASKSTGETTMKLTSIALLLGCLLCCSCSTRTTTTSTTRFGIVSRSKLTLTVFTVTNGRVVASFSKKVAGSGVECTPGQARYSCPGGGDGACKDAAKEGEKCTWDGKCICGLTSADPSKGELFYTCDCKDVTTGVGGDIDIPVIVTP